MHCFRLQHSLFLSPFSAGPAWAAGYTHYPNVGLNAHIKYTQTDQYNFGCGSQGNYIGSRQDTIEQDEPLYIGDSGQISTATDKIADPGTYAMQVSKSDPCPIDNHQDYSCSGAGSVPTQINVDATYDYPDKSVNVILKFLSSGNPSDPLPLVNCADGLHSWTEQSSPVGIIPYYSTDDSSPVFNLRPDQSTALDLTQTQPLIDQYGIQIGTRTKHLEVTLDPVPYNKDFSISFSTFIPANYVTAPPQFSCFSQTEGKRVVLLLHGDDRNFDPNSDSYRSRQLVTVVTGPNGGIKDGTVPQNLVGTSKAYAPDALADDGRLGPNDDDAVLNDCHLLHKVATASNTGMHITAKRISDTQTSVHLSGSVKLPFKPEAPAPGACAIDWDLTLVIDTSDSAHTKWTLNGKHDGFPAYEMYINNIPIHRTTPGPGPYSITQVLQLCQLVPGSASVSDSGTL